VISPNPLIPSLYITNIITNSGHSFPEFCRASIMKYLKTKLKSSKDKFAGSTNCEFGVIGQICSPCTLH
jgi:hypothetical protein